MLPVDAFNSSCTSGRFNTSVGEATYCDIRIRRYRVLNKSSYKINRSYETGQKYITGVIIYWPAREYNDLYKIHECNTNLNHCIPIGINVKITYNGVPIVSDAFQNYSNEIGPTDVIFTVVFRRVNTYPNEKHLVVFAKEIHISSYEPIPEISSLVPIDAYYPIGDEISPAYISTPPIAAAAAPQLPPRPVAPQIASPVAPRPSLPVVTMQSEIKTDKLQYDSIPQSFIESIKEDCRTCSICRETVVTGGCVTKCYHLFHNTCIEKWVVTKGATATCPVCRKK
jgi:hypothetical protein